MKYFVKMELRWVYDKK